MDLFLFLFVRLQHKGAKAACRYASTHKLAGILEKYWQHWICRAEKYV